MRGFTLQTKAIENGIWYEPRDILWKTTETRSDSVEVLREEIRERADKRTLGFTEHVRIITDSGDPVERWAIRPGQAKKLRRKY